MENNNNSDKGTEIEGAQATVSRPWLMVFLLPAAVIGVFALLIWGVMLTTGISQAGGTVTLLFFDRNGTALTPSQVRLISNNNGAGYNSDFLLNPTNMRAISSGPLYTSGSNLAFNIPSQAATTFTNIETSSGRVQKLHAKAAQIDLSQIPQTWRKTPIIHLLH